MSGKGHNGSVVKMKKFRFRCMNCSKLYEENEIEYTCPQCGTRLGTLETLYDFDSITVKKSDFDSCSDIWQFEALLPVSTKSFRVNLKIGSTPLYSFENLSGVKEVQIKYDGTTPTASFKDRATVIAVNKAIEKNYSSIYCASTGNAAASLAGLSAAAGLKAYIFIPSKAPAAKIAQLMIYNAMILAIDSDYDTAFDLSLKIGEEKNWYCRNSAINPYLIEGKKTAAMEICVQTEFDPPDIVIVPVGDGTVISSFYKGFSDFYNAGIIKKIPQLIGVQACGANSLELAFKKGEPFWPVDFSGKTIADSINVGKPRDFLKACTYIKKSKGDLMSVTDDEILSAQKELASSTGIFSEPAGAASYAALKKLVGENRIEKSSRVCLAVTGNGLKDISAVSACKAIEHLKPDVQDIKEYIDFKETYGDESYDEN
jgi:threonine synthase